MSGGMGGLRTAPNIGGGSTARLLKKLTGVHAQEKLIREIDPEPKPIPTPEDPPPTPAPIPGREEDEAKKKARRRAGKGRQQNILAGRLMAQRRGNILNTRLG